MESIASYGSNMPAYGNFGEISKDVSATQYSRIEASSTQSKDIAIYTDEGDKVTLSYNQASSLTYANLNTMSYEFDFSSDENQAMVKETLARLEAEMFSFDTSREITLSIEGDLNEQELNDIKQVLTGIDKIMTDLLKGGDISEAMADAQEIKDLDTIAGLEAEYTYEKSVLIQRVTEQKTEYSANTGWDKDNAFGRHRQRGDSFMKRLDRMSDWIENAHVKPSHFLNPLEKMFANIKNRHDEDTGIERARKNVSQLFENKLLKRTRQMSEHHKTGK